MHFSLEMGVVAEISLRYLTFQRVGKEEKVDGDGDGGGGGGDGVGGDGVGGDVGGRYLYLPKSWQGGEGGDKKVEDWTRGFLSIFSLEAMTLPLKVI